MPASDSELMERFGAGDDEAFRDLVGRHQKPLINFFWRRCFDRQIAQDCTQEVFLRLVRHRGRWKPQAKFTTYMYRIAENLWIDRYRSKKAAPPMTSLQVPVGDHGGELGGVLPGRSRLPEDGAADGELAQKIRTALATLTEEQRSVFLLAETKGLKYADIGDALGIPVGTVKSRMHAAIHKLRALLEEEADEHLR
jgi:RNA polymerase sigma-70 factor (ECF subfamily)